MQPAQRIDNRMFQFQSASDTGQCMKDPMHFSPISQQGPAISLTTGRGVCHWKFSYVSAMLRATGDEKETRFLLTIEAEEIAAGKTVTWYFWKGRYPVDSPLPSNGKGFSTSGYRSPEEFKVELRKELFSVTLAAKELQP
jgi:hypothetical protein